MKRSIPVIVFLLSFFSQTGKAQSFKVAHDTVLINVTSDTSYYDNLTNLSSSPITVSWRVVASNFPSDWVKYLAFCDNITCYYNAASILWPSATTNTSAPFASGTSMVFDNVTDLRSTTSRGCYYVTVRFNNTAIPTDTAYETFTINCATGVNTVTFEPININLYPNPATDNLNISYSTNVEIEKIGLYNIVGEEIAGYKTTNPTITNISTAALPTGMYFVRLINSAGNVIAVQKFLKQ